MRGHKLRSGVDWEGALKQKSVQQTGIKQGQCLMCVLTVDTSSSSYSTTALSVWPWLLL